MKTLTNRHEILFMYDICNSNPNGDPLDENKPRIDEESLCNLVTDVRLKRSIRDELDRTVGNEKGLTIFIKETRKKDGNLKEKNDRLNDLKINDASEMLNKCLDIRLFGGTTAIKNNTITFTGPVQFKMGRSLHKVNPKFIKGTTVMPSKGGAKQGTFREEYILPYSFILFYGIANENAAIDTQMTDKDLDLMLKAMWNGTKNLISRSKIGQVPRLLIDISYNEPHFHLGDIDNLLSLESDKRHEQIRDISDFTLDVEALVKKISKTKKKIDKIRVISDERLQLKGDIEGLSVKKFDF